MTSNLSDSPSSSLTAKVADGDFPCIMAKTVFNQGQAHQVFYADMAEVSEFPIQKLLEEIYLVLDIIQQSAGYHSMVIEFGSPIIRCEQQFEALMWKFLQALNIADSKTYRWDPTVASDPNSHKFSYSLREEAFYIIGMHPAASRVARQTERPTLIFNLHSQFEKIRGLGKYSSVRDKIRARDVVYSGSSNPMMEDFGSTSEATQYSGRHFDKEKWECPFKANQTAKN